MSDKAGKPVIAVTCAHNSEQERFYVYSAYTRALEMAGGVPVILPALWDYRDLEVILPRIDGILLPGGIDVDPAHFDEEPIRGTGSIDPEWDELELSVARYALEKDIPIFGICRGAQVLNVAAGGSLYQDLPSQKKESDLQHYQTAPRWHPTHEVTISTGSILTSLLDTNKIRVNSFHHQAVKVPAPDFDVTARAKDGVVEAVESAGHRFALAVQWHPEYMVERHPVFLRLFEGLIAAAKNRH